MKLTEGLYWDYFTHAPFDDNLKRYEFCSYCGSKLHLRPTGKTYSRYDGSTVINYSIACERAPYAYIQTGHDFWKDVAYGNPYKTKIVP